MITLDEVAAIALALPGVTESDRGGTRTWSVADKAFGWERRFSKADLKRFGTEEPPAGPIVAVRVASLDEKDAILGLDRSGFFTIPHFDGYPAVLVQLAAVDPEAVRVAIVEGWRASAPRTRARARAPRTRASARTPRA